MIRKIKMRNVKEKQKINKKANALTDLFIWIIVGFISILFLGVWIYGHNLLTDELVGANLQTNGSNISQIAQDTFGQVNDAMSILHLVALSIIFGSIIAIFVSNFLVKAHPVFLGLYIFFIIIAVILAAAVSNAYEILLKDEVIGATLTAFKGSTFIMLNLPKWVTLIGVAGGIFLFSGIAFDKNSGGSII